MVCISKDMQTAVKKKNRDTFNSITMDKAKDYFGLLGDLCSTSLVIFKISRVHSHFRIYIHADDVKSWTAMHACLRATPFSRVLGSNQQPLSCVCITTINEKHLKDCGVEFSPVCWRLHVWSYSCSDADETPGTDISVDGWTTYSLFHKALCSQLGRSLA